MIESLLVSKREAAAMLGVSIRTLENLIALRELPVRRVGRRCLIERQALERFVKRDHATRLQPKVGSRDPRQDWPEAVSKVDQNKLQRKGNEDGRQGAQLQPQQ